MEGGGKQTINPMEYTLVVVRYSIRFCINGLLHATCRPVASMGAGGARAPPVFGRSVNPISTREAHYAHHITKFHPGFSDLASSDG